MTLVQATLLLQLINMGIDTAIRLQLAYNKVVKMTDAECQAFIDSEHKRTELLMVIVDAL